MPNRHGVTNLSSAARLGSGRNDLSCRRVLSRASSPSRQLQLPASQVPAVPSPPTHKGILPVLYLRMSVSNSLFTPKLLLNTPNGMPKSPTGSPCSGQVPSVDVRSRGRHRMRHQECPARHTHLRVQAQALLWLLPKTLWAMRVVGVLGDSTSSCAFSFFHTPCAHLFAAFF
jgi:hypothetical protein